MPGQDPCITIVIKPCSPGYFLHGDKCVRQLGDHTVEVEVPIWRNRYVTQYVYREVPIYPGGLRDLHEERVIVVQAPQHTFKDAARMLVGKADAQHAIQCRDRCPTRTNRMDPVLRRDAREKLVRVDTLKTWTPPPYVPPRLTPPEHVTLKEMKEEIAKRVKNNVRRWVTHMQEKMLDKGRLTVPPKGPGLTPESNENPPK